MQFEWRGPVTNREMNELHAEAFDTRVFSDEEWDWETQLERHSLGWATGRHEGILVGFSNVITDGSVHAWLQDVMVAAASRRRGIGVYLVTIARVQAHLAGCEYLHVDFDDEHREFYFGACGFEPANAGLIRLP